MGLNDKLKLAATSKVVETLLAEGTKYTMASPKTQRRWKHVAARRVKDIQLAQEVKAVSEKKAEKAEKTEKPTKAKRPNA